VSLWDTMRAVRGSIRWRRMPWPLPLGALMLTVLGAAFIWSSHSQAFAVKHLAFGGLGCIMFCVVAVVDYRHAAGITLPLYILGLLALVGLWTPLGLTVNNARRWYELGLFRVQPSEPMKLLLALALADYFRFPEHTKRLRDLGVPLAMSGAAMALIIIQPDFGTAVMLVPVFCGVAFLGGVPWRNMGLLAVVGCALLAAAWFTPGVLKQYQRDRVISFLNPAANPESSASYNAEQAMLAISAGGMKGQGWGRGVLNRLGRVPERHTDFIFPVIAEEWGFARTAPVVVIYVILVASMVWVMWRTEDPFGALVVGGVLSVFAVQALLHVAISLRLAPITGLTLPLVSYGGSSLLTTYAAFGLVASVAMHRRRLFRGGAGG